MQKTYVSKESFPEVDFLHLKRMGYTNIQFPSTQAKHQPIKIIRSLGTHHNDIELFEVSHPSHIDILKQLISQKKKDFIIEVIVSKRLTQPDIHKVFHLASQNETPIYLTPSFSFKKTKHYYSPPEIENLKVKLQKKQFKILPRKDLCAPNMELKHTRYYEDNFRILLDNTSATPPLFTVVIPAYNNKSYTLHTLRHLREAYQADPCFEVILVDDGSSDQLSDEVLQNNPLGATPFKLIYNPRTQPRSMGDHQYRAGLSRNIGAGLAQGEYLFFLDCDILIPSNTFLNFRKELKNADLIMCQREHIRPTTSLHLPHLSSIQPTHLRDSDYGYWKTFYKNKDLWDSMPDKWRYVCTHSLCLKKSLFHEAGGIPNNYNVYGYEDVELGFHIAKLGKRYKLSENIVYHLSPTKSRSEFSHIHYKKMKLLKKSSKIFYYNTLDSDVFKHTEHIWGRSNLFFLLYSMKMNLPLISQLKI